MRYHAAMKQQKRPPSDRSQGRKPISPDEETIGVTIRMLPSQRKKLTDLGGAAWVRERIDRAKAPVKK